MDNNPHPKLKCTYECILKLQNLFPKLLAGSNCALPLFIRPVNGEVFQAFSNRQIIPFPGISFIKILKSDFFMPFSFTKSYTFIISLSKKYHFVLIAEHVLWFENRESDLSKNMKQH